MVDVVVPIRLLSKVFLIFHPKTSTLMNAFLRNAYRYFYIFTALSLIMLLVYAIKGQNIDYQLYLCAGFGIVAVALHAWYYIRRRKALSGNAAPMLDTGESLDLLEEALTALGCQPTTHKKEGKIIVAYQGENLIFDVRGNNVRIVDYAWRQVDKNDPDFTPKLMAVNYANESFMSKFIYGKLDDGNIGISTYMEFILHSDIKRLDLFLSLLLQNLLHSHRNLDETYLAMVSPNDRTNNDTRRPVGFATADEDKNADTNNAGEQSEANQAADGTNEVKAETSMRRPVGFATADEGNID